MAHVTIEHTTDSYNGCELCGSSYAEGANIFVDGVLVIELKPAAHCTSGAHFSEEDIMRAVLNHFGHTMEPSVYV